jgi:plastocyanin
MMIAQKVRLSRRALISGALAVTASGVAGCLSDRATMTGLDATSCSVQIPSAAFGSAVVVIRNFTFNPAQVRVRPGTKVTWVNCGAPGSDSHTSTANAGAWSSPLLAPGATYTKEFPAAGSFAYHCEPHPGMTGNVTVE